MARLPRLDLSGVPQHVVVRGNDRQRCFVDDDDRRMYRAWLRDAARAHECDVHAFVLMTNHVHLLMTGRSLGAVSATMQALGRRYVRRFNERHGRSGTLFEGRYRASLVASERYVLTCMRYIELNPVRAGIVARARDYPWSSHRTNAGRQPFDWLVPHDVYRSLGVDDPERARQYRALFDKPLDIDEVDAIRAHLNKDCVLAVSNRQAEIAQLVGRRTHIVPLGRPRREPAKKLT